jgi:hypothetical protein
LAALVVDPQKQINNVPLSAVNGLSMCLSANIGSRRVTGSVRPG